MRSQDFFRLVAQSIIAHRMRSTLTALGIGIGVTAVVLLTSIGEGLNQYVVEQFTQFGTTTLAVQPGKSSTFGISPGVLNSVRPLSLADAEAIARAPYVLHSVPVVTGSGTVEANGRERSVAIYGVGPDFDEAFKFTSRAACSCPTTSSSEPATWPCWAPRPMRSCTARRTRSASGCASAVNATA